MINLRSTSMLIAGVLLLSACTWKSAPVTPKSPLKSVSKESLEAAAGKGDANAAFELGAMYHDGDGVPKDFDKALSWFLKAADKNDVRAEFNIGVMYYEGEGMKQDFAKAKSWFEKAAASGNPRGQFNLGVMYYRGEGMDINLKEAHNLFTASAMQNFSEAQFNLGVMEAKGEGTPVDMMKAYAWFSLALENGNQRAKEVLLNVEKEVTPEQLKALKAGAVALKTAVQANMKKIESEAALTK